MTLAAIVCPFCHKAGYHATAAACDVAPGKALIPFDAPRTARGRAIRLSRALMHQADDLLAALRKVWPRR